MASSGDFISNFLTCAVLCVDVVHVWMCLCCVRGCVLVHILCVLMFWNARMSFVFVLFFSVKEQVPPTSRRVSMWQWSVSRHQKTILRSIGSPREYSTTSSPANSTNCSSDDCRWFLAYANCQLTNGTETNSGEQVDLELQNGYHTNHQMSIHLFKLYLSRILGEQSGGGTTSSHASLAFYNEKVRER